MRVENDPDSFIEVRGSIIAKSYLTEIVRYILLHLCWIHELSFSSLLS